MTISPLLLLSLGLVVLVAGVCIAAGWVALRQKHMHLWLPAYVVCSGSQRRNLDDREPVDVFLAICDHFEPEFGHAEFRTALERVGRWCDQYPRRFAPFRDCRGRVPQHTFFFPQDQYRPEYLDRLSELCRAGYGDVEIHLHHDDDTAEALREKLDVFRHTLFQRHGLLRRAASSGEIVYGFIHGNWALCNSHPEGRWCGVNEELTVLRDTGCYADFTMPSAPDPTQTRTINSIYYAVDRAGRPKSHDVGVRARVGQRPPDEGLLMIQGPLGLDWGHRKFGLLPRTENAELHGTNPPTLARLRLWLRAGVHVAGKPNWVFVKLHTHGCNPANMDMLLGPAMERFHAELAEYATRRPGFRYFYVTAWEMAQLVHQAEQGAKEPSFEASGPCIALDLPAGSDTLPRRSPARTSSGSARSTVWD